MGIQPNAVFLADCLDLLERVDDESVQLVYLDPPTFQETMEATGVVSDTVADESLFEEFLEFLSNVIQQSHRILSNTGNLFFLTKPDISNYVRVILDQFFGRRGFRAEFILPKRRHRGAGRQLHDTILLYGKTENSLFNPPSKLVPVEELGYRLRDEGGAYRVSPLLTSVNRPSLVYEWNSVLPPAGKSWRYSKQKMDELEAQGKIEFKQGSKAPMLRVYADEEIARVDLDTIWDDLPSSVPNSETQQFSTQQPLALLIRVISAGSNPGDIIVDPFSGSGTALAAAEMLGRRWIGGDSSLDAVEIIRKRLNSMEGGNRLNFFSYIADEVSKFPVVSQAYFDVYTGIVPTRHYSFELNKPVNIEETRHFEFKEVHSKNVIGSIKNTADEYAVAFLNSEGGRIFWGVRDTDRVAIGVFLDSAQRDQLRKDVTNKLNEIQPKLSPSEYRIEIHPLFANGSRLDNVWIVEIVIPRPRDARTLYSTGSNEVFLKTDSGKRKLSFTEMQQEIVKRNS